MKDDTPRYDTENKEAYLVLYHLEDKSLDFGEFFL